MSSCNAQSATRAIWTVDCNVATSSISIVLSSGSELAPPVQCVGQWSNDREVNFLKFAKWRIL